MRVLSLVNTLIFHGCGLLSLSALAGAEEKDMTLEELQAMVIQLKGDDTRLFRWSAGEVTAAHQAGGSCNPLADVAQLLIDKTDDDWLIAAADYCTLCITDNPGHRATFSLVPDIHKAVVEKLVPSENPAVSALGGHLIYIATYTNEKNHQYFYQQGAVSALSKVVVDETAIPIQKMYAASALQNMAASYCETHQDGCCYWEWTDESPDVQLDPQHSTEIFSDGSKVRKAMLRQEGLIEALTELACHPPILPHADDSIVMPGDSAIAEEDDHEPQIVTWAAMAALKNLALEPSAKPELDKALECACYLKFSMDWLEESKSYGLIQFLRRTGDPCWWRGATLCIDDDFLDGGLYTCSDYEGSNPEECQGEDSKDIFTGEPATKACCECGGGIEVPNREHSTTGDEL